jgi:DNA mismatch endonuclease (patch repair protein)
MQGNRSKDTTPERALRSAVYALNLRYRVAAKLPLPGVRRTADLVFTKVKVAVFMDGCFWHGCPSHYSPPKTNADYWAEKVDGNRRRDADTDRRLREAGWSVIRVWEHEDPVEAAARIEERVRALGG